MKKIAILSILFFSFCLRIQAQDVLPVTINVATAGSLPSLIATTKKDLITNLTVTGNLNGTDIRYIHEMAGSSINGSTTTGKLSVLDLFGANIVGGGDPYFYQDDKPQYTSLNEIGDYAFKNCKVLTSVIIPINVISIGNSAFYGCIGLTSIIIPNSVTSIEKFSFGCCKGLTSITIPNNLKSIDEAAFIDCI